MVAGMLVLAGSIGYLAGGKAAGQVALALLLTASVLLGTRCLPKGTPLCWYHSLQLRRAIARGDIRAWYQPLVRYGPARISGCEMLARWHSGGRVLHVEPFLVRAGGGMQVLVSRLLIRQSLRDLRYMADALPAGFVFSFMVRAAHAGSRGFIRDCLRLQKLLAAQSGLLMVGISAGEDFSRAQDGAANLAMLRAAGVMVFLDNLEGGIATQHCPDRLPVDGVLLDCRHVQMTGMAARHAWLTGLGIRTARRMSLEVMATGVDTRSQHDWLLLHDVLWQQGEWFSPALRAVQLKFALIHPLSRDGRIW